jgi:hypothetical protein
MMIPSLRTGQRVLLHCQRSRSLRQKLGEEQEAGRCFENFEYILISSGTKGMKLCLKHGTEKEQIMLVLRLANFYHTTKCEDT